MAARTGSHETTTAATAAAAMSTTLKRNDNGISFITLQIAALFFFSFLSSFIIPMSDASFWRSPQKTVTIQNIDKIEIIVRCFSFDDDRPVQNLKPQEEYSFVFRQSVILPLSTMWNCSTHVGTFTVFRDEYDCNKNESNACKWKFNLQEVYRFSPKHGDWIAYEYNPNYESLRRGGVVKGQYAKIP
ncbi:hypothetical protein U1Q18_041305 [Sarracenia purpurea var. burkii]